MTLPIPSYFALWGNMNATGVAKSLSMYIPKQAAPAYARFPTFPHLWKKLWKTNVLPDLWAKI